MDFQSGTLTAANTTYKSLWIMIKATKKENFTEYRDRLQNCFPQTLIA